MESMHGEQQMATAKRPLELTRPEFTARDDGTYHVLEMPKRLRRCGGRGLDANNPRGRQPRSHLLAAAVDGEAKKRPLELARPEFVAREEDGGSYYSVEMPKRLKFPGCIDGEDARTTAMAVRGLIRADAYIGELKASIGDPQWWSQGNP